MRLIRPLVIVEDDLDMLMPNGLTLAQHMMKKVEYFARKCYKSEGKMTEESFKKFVPAIFSTKRHTGIAEHRLISVTFITDRGVSHEGLRHRMAAPYLFDGDTQPIESGEDAWLQESTRYCDYSGKGVCYVLPPWMHKSEDSDEWIDFIGDLKNDDERYTRYRAKEWKPEQARGWLPQFVKTEYVGSKNLGSWWNFCLKRTPEAAHPSMRQLAIPLYRYFLERLPEIFGSIEVKKSPFPGKFEHKGVYYKEAKLVVNPFYDQVPYEEVYSM